MNRQLIPQQAMYWQVPRYKWGNGQPWTNWKGTVNKDQQKMGLTWQRSHQFWFCCAFLWDTVSCSNPHSFPATPTTMGQKIGKIQERESKKTVNACNAQLVQTQQNSLVHSSLNDA